MENPILSQCPEGTVTYDYRMYDRIWQRVSPDLDPYPDVRAANAAGAQNAAATPPVSAPAPAAPRQNWRHQPYRWPWRRRRRLHRCRAARLPPPRASCLGRR